MPRSTSQPTTVPGSNDSCATVPVLPSPSNGIEASNYGATGGERIVYRLPDPEGVGTEIPPSPVQVVRPKDHEE